ncbi:MAG: hypothetical protein AB7P12_15655 [Alphaproteobacteria bacterium]
MKARERDNGRGRLGLLGLTLGASLLLGASGTVAATAPQSRAGEPTLQEPSGKASPLSASGLVRVAEDDGGHDDGGQEAPGVDDGGGHDTPGIDDGSGHDDSDVDDPGHDDNGVDHSDSDAGDGADDGPGHDPGEDSSNHRRNAM